MITGRNKVGRRRLANAASDKDFASSCSTCGTTPDKVARVVVAQAAIFVAALLLRLGKWQMAVRKRRVVVVGNRTGACVESGRSASVESVMGAPIVGAMVLNRRMGVMVGHLVGGLTGALVGGLTGALVGDLFVPLVTVA